MKILFHSLSLHNRLPMDLDEVIITHAYQMGRLNLTLCSPLVTRLVLNLLYSLVYTQTTDNWYRTVYSVALSRCFSGASEVPFYHYHHIQQCRPHFQRGEAHRGYLHLCSRDCTVLEQEQVDLLQCSKFSDHLYKLKSVHWDTL